MNEHEEIEVFAQEVLNHLLVNKIPPSPHNFDFYFNELLKNKSPELQEILSIYKNINQDINNETILDLNYAIKEGFINVRKMYQLSNNMSSNTKKVHSLVSSKKTNMSAIASTLAKFSSVLIKQNEEIKKIEKSTKNILTNLQKNNIYDSNYQVFNKKHILQLIDKEIELMEKHEYSSSMLFFKIKDIEEVEDAKQNKILNNLLSKILIKNARNSDFIGYIGENIFMILLAQTNMKNAKLTKQRIEKLIQQTILYLGEKEVILDVKIKERFLTINTDTDEILMTIDDELEMC